ncbi:MAG: LOG family protein [Acidobacteriota bacterium]|nr:LOG family protein [Acidobacteriota bacterium]
MKRTVQIVTVFGSSRPRSGHAQYASALGLGVALAEKGWVVCSGGYTGVMEAVSRGAKEAGGRTIAVTANSFSSRANPWIDEEIRVDTWQERLFELIARGHGYVACPGGTGTLAELAVVWEMLNKGVIRSKPMVVLGKFWQPVIECVCEVETGHASPWDERDRELIYSAATAADAVEFLATNFADRPSAAKGKLVQPRKSSAS